MTMSIPPVSSDSTRLSPVIGATPAQGPLTRGIAEVAPRSAVRVSTPSTEHRSLPEMDAAASAADLRTRYEAVKQTIARACKKAGRDPSSVVLVAVTKHAEPDQIRELIRLGHSDFGENRVQQLTQRAAIIDEWMTRQRGMHGAAAQALPPVRWHMIGHLQRNKARKVIELCRLIHSVDSLRLAEELQLIAAKRERPVEMLLQVNCSGEASKFGCAIGAAIHLVEQIETMVQVRVRGLMTMAPLSSNPEDARATFGRCRELFNEIRDSGVVNPARGGFDILSMGMSGDYEIAIEEGANLVRVGTALFGEPRPGSAEDDERDGSPD